MPERVTHKRVLLAVMRVDRWDRRKRQQLLAEHNAERLRRRQRIQRACSDIGHEWVYAYTTVGGDDRMRCSWCGALKGVEHG